MHFYSCSSVNQRLHNTDHTASCPTPCTVRLDRTTSQIERIFSQVRDVREWLETISVTVSSYESYLHTYRKQMQHSPWWDIIHTKSESATNMNTHSNTQYERYAVQPERARHTTLLRGVSESRHTPPDPVDWTRPTAATADTPRQSLACIRRP